MLSDTVQDVTPETLTPKKITPALTPNWANIATRGETNGPTRGKQKKRGTASRKEVETNGRQMSMEEDGRHQTKPGKQKETKARRGKTATKAPGQMKGDKDPGTRWWTHPPTTRLTHLRCIENPDNQLFRENWGYALWRIMWLQDLQAMCGLTSGNARFICKLRWPKEIVSWPSLSPILAHVSLSTWKHYKHSLQSVVWRK